jgi:GSH-dependent disulfide-bond oxidoreductase
VADQPHQESYDLYGARTGNCLRAAIALSEAGVPFTPRAVDLRTREQRGPTFMALNPSGQVPVLVQRLGSGAKGFVLSQSVAITLYAAEYTPGGLLPLDVNARFKVLEAYFYFVADVIGLNGVAFALKGDGFGEAAQSLTRRYLARLTRGERFISEHGFMAGDRFSIADIAAFTISSAVAEDVPWTTLPRLADWRDRIAERPSVQRGMHLFDKTT